MPVSDIFRVDIDREIENIIKTLIKDLDFVKPSSEEYTQIVDHIVKLRNCLPKNVED